MTDRLVLVLYLLQTELPVHLPVGKVDDVAEHGGQVGKAKLCGGVKQRLARHAVAQDEDDEQHHEDHDLPDHPVEHDQLGPEPPAGVVHAEQSAVEQGCVNSKEDPRRGEGGLILLQHEAEDGDGADGEVELVPRTRKVATQLLVERPVRLGKNLPRLLQNQNEHPNVGHHLASLEAPAEVVENNVGVEQEKGNVSEEIAGVFDNGSVVENINLLTEG